MSASDNWSGGDRGSQGSGGDPYAAGGDPYAAGRDPYATGGDPYTGGGALYAAGRYPSAHGTNSYGQSANGPLDGAPGFAPEFGTGPAYVAQTGPYAPPAPSSNSAITTFVLGLVSLVFCAGLPAPVGLFFAVKAMKDTAPTASPVKSGRGFAITGLVLNIIGMLYLIGIVLYIVFIVGLVALSETSGY